MARPTKQTEATKQAIFDSLRKGNTRAISAAAAGVSYDTFYRMLRADDQFRADVEQAEAQAVMFFVDRIKSAAYFGDWKAAAYWLEKRQPAQWGKRQPIEADSYDLSVLTDDELTIMCKSTGLIQGNGPALAIAS